jgi:O-antigen/teichoic acid export membrane protein
VSTLFSFAAMRWDVFSLGRLEGFALLGVYGLATQIANVPGQMSMQVTNSVLTPVLAEAWRGATSSAGGLQASMMNARRSYIPAGMLLFLGAAATAPAFFVLAYKPGFHGAGPMAQLLMVPFWLGFLQEASSRALLASGDGRGLALSNGVRVLVTIASTLIGFELWGFWGFVGAGGVGALVGMIIVGVRLREQNLSAVLVDDLKATGVFLLLLGFICAPPLLLSTTTGVASAWLTLGTGALVLVPLALVVVQRVRARRAG